MDKWMLPKLAHFEIKPETLKLIAAIDEFKGAWRAIGRIAPEHLSALRRVATIESAASFMDKKCGADLLLAQPVRFDLS